MVDEIITRSLRCRRDGDVGLRRGGIVRFASSSWRRREFDTINRIQLDTPAVL